MAHQRQQDFCKRVKAVFPEYFRGVNVCDIGSLDINGNNHYLFDDYSYIGLDVGRGKNVNVVCSGHLYSPIGIDKYDIVISTECFEHDMYWDKTIKNVCENLLKENGMFLFTCATIGRPEHGTTKYKPHDSPLTSTIGIEWAEYYKNLTQEDVELAIDIPKYFKIWRFSSDMESHDLYFWGIKH